MKRIKVIIFAAIIFFAASCNNERDLKDKSENRESVELKNNESKTTFRPPDLKIELDIEASIIGVSDGFFHYISNANGIVHVLEPSTGKEKWRFKSNSILRDEDMIVIDSRFFCKYKRFISSFDIYGHENWRYEAKKRIDAFTASRNGTLLLTSDDLVISLSSVSGNEKWRYNANNNNFFIEVTEGVVIIESNNIIHGIDLQSGRLKWKYETDFIENSWKQIASSKGVIAIATGNTNIGDTICLHLIDANTGQEIWKYQTEEDLIANMTIYQNYVISLCRENLYAFDLKSGEQKLKCEVKGHYDIDEVYGNYIYLHRMVDGIESVQAVNLITGLVQCKFQGEDLHAIKSRITVIDGRLYFIYGSYNSKDNAIIGYDIETKSSE